MPLISVTSFKKPNTASLVFKGHTCRCSKVGSATAWTKKDQRSYGLAEEKTQELIYSNNKPSHTGFQHGTGEMGWFGPAPSQDRVHRSFFPSSCVCVCVCPLFLRSPRILRRRCTYTTSYLSYQTGQVWQCEQLAWRCLWWRVNWVSSALDPTGEKKTFCHFSFSNPDKI